MKWWTSWSQVSRANQATEAFGHNWDSESVDREVNAAIKPNQSLSVLFKPLSGLLNQNRMLPIRYAPITIELELVDSVTDPIVDPTNSPTLGGFTFTPAVTSRNWSINKVQVKVDVCTLDNALDNSYAQHLLQGKSFPISHNTFVSQLSNNNRARRTTCKCLSCAHAFKICLRDHA